MAHGALSEALARIDPFVLKRELSSYIPADVQRILASAGIRDEHVFPTPIILEMKPTLLGYYRLLLGVPQKSFYVSNTGISLFRAMEARGVLNDRQKAMLPLLCRALGGGLSELVRQMSPVITQDVGELQLLTVGGQFRATTQWKAAMLDVFLSFGNC